MHWLHALVIPSAFAAFSVQLQYDASFTLTDAPLLSQFKFLSPLPKTKRRLLDIATSANTNANVLDLVYDIKWSVQTLVTSAMQGMPNAWYSQIEVGFPPQRLKLVFDSGSSDLVLYDPSCSKCLGPEQTYFQWNSSRSFQRLASSFTTEYGGSGFLARGYGAEDIVFLSDLPLANQKIAMITNASESRHFSHDGLIGLGQPLLAALPNTTTVFDNLIERHLIEDPLVGIALVQSSNGYGGEVSFGRINGSFTTGPVTYFPVTSSVYWGTALDDISFGSKSMLDSNAPRRAIFDTGTTLMLVSDSVAQAINAQIPGSVYQTGQWHVPCSASPMPLVVQLGGRSWTIPGSDLSYKLTSGACLSSVQGGMLDFFVLGDVFIKNQYLVLHQGNTDMPGKHVGLAKRVDL